MNKDHELYRKFVALNDPTDESGDIKGYVKVSISVMGPGDRPPVHDPSKNLKKKGDAGESKIFSPGRCKMQGHAVKLCIFKAEHLAPLDLLENTIDPYIIASFAGTKAETRTIDNNRNPKYN